MKLHISVTYDVDNRMIQLIRELARLKSRSFEESVLSFYNAGEIDRHYSDKRTAEISIVDEGFYNSHLCVIASGLSTNECHSCVVTDCPHFGHSDKEHFEGVAQYIKCGDTLDALSPVLRYERNKTYYNDRQCSVQQQQYQQEEFQQEQLRLQRQNQQEQVQLQRQQIEAQKKAQKEVSRNAIRAQIATLEAQLNAIPIRSIFGKEDPAVVRARDEQRISLQSQIRALREQLWSI